MTMFIIYENPSDYPGKFVVRGVSIIHGESITKSNMIFDIEPISISNTLDDARITIPEIFMKSVIPRDNSDDPVIVETWL